MSMNAKIDWSAEPDQARLYRAHNMLQTSPVAALRELKELAALGSVMSMVYLGDAYKLGKGTDISLPDAESWYRRAADTGSPLGIYFLGRLYFASKRYTQAIEVFSVAAESDYAPAVHFLGRMYASGKGVKKDLVKAELLLERASKSGSVLAKGVLAHLLTHTNASPSRFARGALLYVSALMSLVVVVITEGITSDRLR